MDRILEVKNLKISFRTAGGILKAVRDISFDLERGKTLAIVGESGSGKSVTSKAILGILAGNSIIEGGKIIYDGKDLLKIDEEEMYQLRGDKIAMIFQDPLSSLNPIVKIGKQITEAMLLKNKAARRESRKNFNDMLALLAKNMEAADGQSAARIRELAKTFDTFCIRSNKLELGYNQADAEAEAMLSSLEDLCFLIEKKQKVDVKGRLKEYRGRLKKLQDPFYSANYKAQIAELAACFDKAAASGKGYPPELTEALRRCEELLREIRSQEKPVFFRIGYFELKNPDADLHGVPVEKLNQMALDFLNDHFMNEFIALAAGGVKYSHEISYGKKKQLLPRMEEAKKYFQGDFDKAGAEKLCKTLSDGVEDAIDRLEIVKDSMAYTFRTSLGNAIEQYFYYQKHNPTEEARFARQSKKRDALIARGRNVDWKVVPKVVCDLEELRQEILDVIGDLEDSWKAQLSADPEENFEKRTVGIVDYLKEQASRVVYRVTRSMAREKAIRLMEEVGINEPRMRFNQYPFEFSGGMRQRIVIAIALSADPEIMICDEPTTALDVTIQAQILELINRLKAERNLSVIFITHDLGVVANMADNIAVMYAGKIVEYGTADDIFYDPRHPYTWALLSSMPDLDTKEKLDAIPGTPPNMIYPPQGAAFAERNKYAMQIDFEQQPPMFEVSPTHKAATWLLHPNAPKVEVPKIITERIERMKKAGGVQNGQ